MKTERRKKQTAEATVRWKERNYEKWLYIQIKSRAKVRNLDFNLDESDIVIPTHCPYLGIELNRKQGRGTAQPDIPSVDRIDPAKGYIKGNIEIISWLANKAKGNLTKDQLVSFATTILSRYEN